MLLACWLAGCGGEPVARDLGRRAVVIGIDGADWTIIEELAAEGGMPHLMGLRRQGTWGPIETLREIPLSPAIWTTIATGRRPTDHGITWFLVDRPEGGRVPVRSHNRRVKALWNILAEHGRRPGVVGWWATYPAEPVGEGVVVSDALGYHGFGSSARSREDGAKTWPPELYRVVAPLVPEPETIDATYAGRYFRMPPSEYERRRMQGTAATELDPSNPVHLFQLYAATAEGYTTIGERLLKEPLDLLMLYFEQVDSLSHLFIKYTSPRLPWVAEEEYRRYREVVPEWYRYQDELLGRLLQRIDLETTAVFVLSDHGFKSGERRIRSEQTVDVRTAHLDHETYGIFVAAGPQIRPAHQLREASVLDVAPTLLHYLGFPVAADMPGRVLEEILVPGSLEAQPVRRIPTYEEPGKTPSEMVSAGVPEEVDAAREQANLEALRALGYLGGVPEEGPAGGSISEGGPRQGKESSPQIHTNLGRIYLADREPERARAEFERALELDPEHADALLGIADLHRYEGRLAQAEHFIQRALATDPSSVGALAQLAALKRDQGELEEALRLFDEALAISGSEPAVLLGKGDVLQRTGRFREAVEAFEAVLALDPDSFRAHYNLGVTYSNSGEVERAIQSYRKALELAPNHPEAGLAHNNLGAIHLARGELAEARSRFEQAVALSPAHLEARYNLAMVYLPQGRTEEAISLLEEAARVQPNHVLVATRLGWAYLQQGRNQEAFRNLLLVRRLAPGNWEASLGLALLHAASGQHDEARRMLAEALEHGGPEAHSRAAAFELLAPHL